MKESNKDLIIGVLVSHLGYEVLNSRICLIGEEIYNKLCNVNNGVLDDVIKCDYCDNPMFEEHEPKKYACNSCVNNW